MQNSANLLVLFALPFFCDQSSWLPFFVLQGRKTQIHVALRCDLCRTRRTGQQVVGRAQSHGQHSHQVPQGPGRWRRGPSLAAVRRKPSVPGQPGPECILRRAVRPQHAPALRLPPCHDTSAQVTHPPFKMKCKISAACACCTE